MSEAPTIVVCPFPYAASGIYKRLRAEWERAGSMGDPPPLPLILDGWHYSSDVDKQTRWEQVVAWAESHGQAGVMSSLKADDYYRVSQLSTSYPEQHYRLDRYDEREHPPENKIRLALSKLHENWGLIVGETISQRSAPKAITGKKARRLLVQVEEGPTPSWGGWTWLGGGEKAQQFTEFRKRINELISPVEIDHVDFEIVPD